MEDMIIKKLCNFCKNKNERCMKYEEHKQSDLKVYKCNNYIKDEKMIKGYDEKWLDTALKQIIFRNMKKGARQK